MILDKIKSELKYEWAEYEKVLYNAMKSDNNLISQINSHILNNRGKELRPMLSLLTSKMLGNVSNVSILCAVASEVIHNASLLHDDVIDNSDLRRDKPTVNMLFSPSAAVLMGDFWMSRAVKLLLADRVDDEILRTFTQVFEDLSVGEMKQMELTSHLDMTEGQYEDIIYHKTATLFVGSMRSTAIHANVEEDLLIAIENFGKHFGLAFQIRDDVLDYSPHISTGKPSCADIMEKKITLPLIGAFANASYDGKRDEAGAIMKSIENLESADCDVADTVLAFVEKYNGVEFARNAMKRNIDKAIENLQKFPANIYRDYLHELVMSL